jgi:hypothetical protein
MTIRVNPRIAYKYRSGDPNTLQRDLQSLVDSRFYAAVRHELNDPFEGRFDRSSINAQFSALQALISGAEPKATGSLDNLLQATDEVLKFVDKSGVFSLSYNPLQELIWAHYGGSHGGFCIGYDTQKLIDFEPNIHHVLDVKYSNVAPNVGWSELVSAGSPVTILRTMLGVKSSPWSYEEEVRIITQPPGLHDHDYRAVKVIYFGLRCPKSTMKAVMEALAGRGVTYKQVVSLNSSYALSATTIPDQCISAVKYKANCAPIDEGAIPSGYLKPEQEPYARYLSKAAEIVRREPYCQEVKLVDFSSSKSTRSKPIIYVQYLRAPNKWVNHYLALPEIDEQYAALGLENGEQVKQ